MFQGKQKAVTFSYDDGVMQDVRLMELFSKYGLKATFNLNSGCFGAQAHLVREGATVEHFRFQKEDIKSVYDGFEVAAHTLTHPSLYESKDEAEIIRQVEQDRLNLSDAVGYEVVGFAYPNRGRAEECRFAADVIKQHTGVKYARLTETTHTFDLPENPFLLAGSAYHRGDREILYTLAEQFVALKPDTPQLFYVWGHSYEFDIDDSWGWFEEFLQIISGHDDIFYGTNKEVLL